MERTKIIFDARLSERPICPDIEQSLAQCYRYTNHQKYSRLLLFLVKIQHDRYFVQN